MKIIAFLFKKQSKGSITPCSINRTIEPDDRPDFEKWVKEFRVGTNHNRHGSWTEESVSV